MTLKFGLTLRFRNPADYRRTWEAVYDENLAMAERAEEFGFDGIWVAEHHAVKEGYNPTPFVVLAAIAARTASIRIGTQPLLLPLYHPLHVAEQAAVVDIISGGRLILGVGAGYRHGDFTAFGRNRSQRATLMDESCELLELLFTSPGPVTFNGDHFQTSGAELSPRPVQSPRPDMFYAVRSEAAAERAGKWAYSINVFPDQDQMPKLLDRYVSSMKEYGHNPHEREVALMMGGLVEDSRARAQQLSSTFSKANQYFEWMTEGGRTDAADRRRLAPPPRANGYGAGLLVVDDWLRAIGDVQQMLADCPVKLGWLCLSIWPEGMSLDDGTRTLERMALKIIPRCRD